MNITATTAAKAPKNRQARKVHTPQRLLAKLAGLALFATCALAVAPPSLCAQDAYTLDNDSATISGSLWEVTGTNINIGYDGGASLDIAATGTLVSTGTVFIGRNATGTGTAGVSGLWQNSGPLFVGDAGAGTLVIETGGTVFSDAGSQIGFDSTGTGSAIVRGYWNNNGPLVVGGTGKGSLAIASTGTLISNNFYAADHEGSEANITVEGFWQSNQIVVGQRGAATVDILSGGTMTTSSAADHILLGNTENGMGTINVRDGGYLYSSQQIQVGAVIGGTGVLNIESGAMARTGSGVVVSANGGYGVLNIATGGTLVIDADSLYIGNSGTDYRNAYGEANIDGYVQSGGNGTAYTPVGYSGTGVLNIGATGILKTGMPDVGYEYTSFGTVDIKGRWESVAAGNSQDAFVGHAGEGHLVIRDGGYLSTTAGRVFYIGSGMFLSDTSAIVGGTGANSVGVGSMLIEEGGVFMRRGASNDMIIAGGTAFFPQNRASGTVTVNGLLDMDRYIRIGGNNGSGELYVGQSGTLYAGGLRVTYTDFKATAKVVVDGEMYLRTLDTGVITAANAYIIVAHYGNSLMHVTQTGTVSATGYISIGQGDFWNNANAPFDYITAYSGSLRVDGYVHSGNYIRVGNRLKGVLDITPTGTVTTTGHIRINENNLRTTSTASVAGYLKANTAIDVAYNANTSAHLDIKDGGNVIAGTTFTNGRVANAVGLVTIADTGTLTVGTNFSQNARSTLDITLANRSTTSAAINVGGIAALSGTLFVHVSGSAAADISYTGGGEGKATDLSGIPIISAPGGITGDFTSVEVTGISIPADLPDYIRGGGMKVNEGGPVDTRYDVGFGLAWRSGVDTAHGDFTVDGGKTFDVNVQLANRPASFVFASGWDGKSLHKKGAGTLILSVENTYTGASTIDSGTLRFTGPAVHRIGDLTNNGTVDFYETDGDGNRIGAYRTISASSLAGDGAYHMGVDMTTGAGDQLIIAGDAHGDHRLLITATATTLTKGDEPLITLVSIGGVNDTSIEGSGTMTGSGTSIGFTGNFDYGLFNYEVQTQGNRVVIVNTGLAPAVFDQIRGTGAQSLLWFDQQDNISRRLGELRAPRESGLGFDIWARGHASGASIGGGDSEMPESDIDIWGAEIGSDYTWLLEDQRATIGIYASLGNASQEFKRLPGAISNSTGESDLLGLGIYGSWLADSGWFANAAASLSQYDNSFDSVDGSDNHTTADYKDRGFGMTIEGGYRFKLSTNGWFIEPSVQGALVRLSRANYTTTGNHKLAVSSSDTAISHWRGIIRVGRAWETRAGWMQIAGRISTTSERSSGGEVIITNDPANRWRPNLDGARYEAGVGVFWQPFETGQLYFDYEYANGDNFEKPWGISLGFRLSL